MDAYVNVIVRGRGVEYCLTVFNSTEMWSFSFLCGKTCFTLVELLDASNPGRIKIQLHVYACF